MQAYRAGLVERAVFGMYRATIDGRLLDTNPALVKMLGYDSATELLATNMRDIYATADERERLIQAYQGREGFEGAKTTWKRKDGRLLEVRLTGRIVAEDDGRVFEAIVEDVTGQRQLEAAAGNADRLRAVGQLAGGIAHEFNNLLSVIIGNSELLREEISPSSAAGASVLEIQTASEKATALTRQLMAFARRQPLQAEPLDVVDLLRRLSPGVRSSLREGISLELELPDRTVVAEVDSVQFEQVILSLSRNASDAMPNGGRLTIELDQIELATGAFGPGIQVPSGRYVLVTIEDTGVGMDDTTKSRIFEPFFSTKPFGYGTGLALAVVYGIVKQHGGFIFVDSQVAHGTRFRLYFRSALAPGGRERAARESSLASQLVLVVDDVESVRRLIARTLTQHGYAVREASGAAEALKIADADNVALVITDVDMPGMNGLELASRLTEQWPGIRILVVSGQVADAGSFAFLPKPFARTELLRRVAELLNERPLGL